MDKIYREVEPFIDKLKRNAGWMAFFILLWGAGCAFGWIWGHRNVPTPKEITVTGNPTQQQEKPATIVLKLLNQGSATGQAQIKPINAPGTNEDSTGWNIPPISFGSGEQAGADFGKGFTATGPISGEIKTTVVNKRTGDELWVGSSPLTGTVTATSLDGQNLDFDIKFDNTQTYAIDLPKEKPKHFEVGFMGMVNTRADWYAGPYGKYIPFTIETKKVDISPWVGVTAGWSNDGAEGWLMAGIGGRF